MASSEKKGREGGIYKSSTNPLKFVEKEKKRNFSSAKSLKSLTEIK